MPRARPWFLPRLDGLAPRVAAFLSIALLPLGMIALWQTREFQRETVARAELSLLALTEQGAQGVGQAIEQALGAGEALGVVADLLDDPETCSGYLARFARSRELYAFVGLLPFEGPITCSSAGRPLPMPADLDLRALRDDPRPLVYARDRGLVSGAPVLVALVPVAPGAGEDGGFPGFIALSIPRDQVATPPVDVPELRPLRLLTFNAAGEVLTVQANAEPEAPLSDLLIPGPPLPAQASPRPRAFEGRSARGEMQVYTVAPIVPGVAYAMAIWSPEQAGQGIGRAWDSPLLFPLLMWGTSLLVAFWAIHRLVIRRVGDLGQRMRGFGRDRSLPDRGFSPAAPHELREIEDAFRQMAHSILHDEARMENAYRERGVLLREVHHRVKNNLQLISSIVSMQMRRLPDPRARSILRRLQDRVLTLAAIYRTLYTSPDMGDVNAAPVLRAIVEQELRAAPGRVEATLDIEDLVLDPDKVVPLAFLAAEAVSNGLARAGSAEGRPSLSVTLHREGDRATLAIANSLGGAPAPEDQPGRGLGQHLIQAFAAQVGGPAETEARDGVHRLSVTFPVTLPAPQGEVEAA
ncbi:sensor histidine kinase [Rubellimicrobium aerolatum]|uniref:histidine kinase n=1 Tax=Rubellimicrobium aerolatum TaxID=490979 RepID=A0ABW0S6Z7_9RHOB|nr:sensor histidine kinase [Rubellimicrobium aerolatum]MBP1804553.1 two-component sensor histidine kinase [Rubellimicrobium aerolatum]